MADSTNPIQQVIAGTGAAIQVNENFAAASPAMLFARNAPTTSGLVWGYHGGRVGGALIANGTLTLAANATSYVVALRSTGAISAATTTTNWANPLYAPLYKVVTGATTITSHEDHRQAIAAVAGSGSGGAGVVAIPIACGSETAPATVGTAKVTFRMPFSMTLTGVRASVTTAPVGSVLTLDINVGGSTILSTKLTIDATEKTSKTAATPAVISSTALADDAEITIDIDAVGSTTAGAGVKVYLIGSLS